MSAALFREVLEAFADRVARRLQWRATAAAWRRLWPAMLVLWGVALGVLPFASWWGASLLALAGCLIAGLIWGRYRRPDRQRALACYDAVVGDHEILLSAWQFGQSASSPAIERHQRAAADFLARAPAPRLHLPVPSLMAPLGVALLLVAVGTASRLHTPTVVEEEVAVGPAMQDRAERLREDLQRAGGRLQERFGEDLPDEAAMVQELLGAAAEALRTVPEDRRDFLKEFDRRLQAVEELVGDLLPDWEADLAVALRDAADTAAIADALRARDADALIRALQELQANLEDDPSQAQLHRLLRTLQRRLPQQGEGALTKAFKELADALQAQDAVAQQEAMRQLLRAARRLGRRQAFGDGLEGLAQQLRRQGQGMFKPGAPTRQPGGGRQPSLAGLGAGRAGLLPLGAGEPAGGGGPAGPAPWSNAPVLPGGTAGPPIPGSELLAHVPVPAAAQPPVPPAQIPVPGMQPGDGGGGAGHNEAGTGTTGLDGGQAPPPGEGNPTVVAARMNAAPAASRRQVQGQEQGGGGESSSRTVDPAVALAEARRAAAAIGEEDLPLQRREHVWRYVTALRQALGE